MKKFAFALLYFCFLSVPLALAQLDSEQTLAVNCELKELTISDLQTLINYLNSSNSPGGNDLLTLAQMILDQKVKEQNIYVQQGDGCPPAVSASLYRTKRIAEILEKALGREVYLNQEEEFVVSNATPVVYQDQSCQFCLRPYQLPELDSCLKDGPVLKVFEQSIKYPDYSVLYWSPTHKEYLLYSVEYERFFGASQLAGLSDDQIIVLFGKLFPVSLLKPAWAWKIFGLTSIKREITNLFNQENKAHQVPGENL